MGLIFLYEYLKKTVAKIDQYSKKHCSKNPVERKSSFITASKPGNGQPISLSMACTWKLNRKISGLIKSICETVLDIAEVVVSEPSGKNKRILLHVQNLQFLPLKPGALVVF